MRLYTFVISHFSEKVRWALDFEGLSYSEERLLPGLHMVAMRRRAPSTTVPLLEHDRDHVQGSSAILDYMQDRLGARKLAPPAGVEKRAAELEALADHAFGLGIQRIFYDKLLLDRATVTDLWAHLGPRWGRAFYAVAFPLVASAVRRTYTIRPDAVARAKDRLRRAVDQMDGILKAQPYLLGDAPTRVDITVAALLAPMFAPPEHLVKWPAIPNSLKEFVNEFEGRPTHEHVLEMYRKHRAPALAGQA